MGPGLDWLSSKGMAEAFDRRSDIPSLALAEKNASLAARGERPYADVEEYLAELRRRTVCLTLLAGSGSRWIASVRAARERGETGPVISFDLARPRGLFPVHDFLGLSRDGMPVPAEGKVAIGVYAFAAVKGLGRHLIVVRGWEKEIAEEILEPLGIGEAERIFFTQEAPLGKPLGHGDATWQCRELWSTADFVITNWGGDANSRTSILSSLLVLDALNDGALHAAGPSGLGREVDLLMPAARVERPAYPISLDENGLPRSFVQPKLQGQGSLGPGSPGYSNVGVRVYRATALLEQVEYFRSRYWEEGLGYAIPGNDPAGREFALDNVDARLASAGMARILAVARPEELAPAKSYDDLSAFERAIASIAGGRADRARIPRQGL